MPDPVHFARSVAQFGERRRVVADHAIVNIQGRKLIDKGVCIDTRLYERLTQHQLAQPLEELVSAEDTVTGVALRHAAEAMCWKHPFFATLLADMRLRSVVMEELQQVPLPGPVAFQLTLAQETPGDLWLHALRSAVVAAWFAVRSEGTRHDVRMLAAAGLVHDLGMLHLDPVMLEPHLALTRPLRRQLYTHPLVSVMILERHHVYPRELLTAVLEHHECLDGSGYPRNVAGAALSPWGRVLSLTEVVTAMFGSSHPAPVRRLSLVLRMNQHRFDPALVAELMGVVTLLREPLSSTTGQANGQANGQALPVLREVNRLLERGPGLPEGTEVPTERRPAEDYARKLCAQALRNLSEAGVSTAQLAQLDAEVTDADVDAELALVVPEAVWQLRSVSRQTRRRWRLSAGEVLPPWLQAWLDEVDTLCASHLVQNELASEMASQSGLP